MPANSAQQPSHQGRNREAILIAVGAVIFQSKNLLALSRGQPADLLAKVDSNRINHSSILQNLPNSGIFAARGAGFFEISTIPVGLIATNVEDDDKISTRGLILRGHGAGRRDGTTVTGCGIAPTRGNPGGVMLEDGLEQEVLSLIHI